MSYCWSSPFPDPDPPDPAPYILNCLLSPEYSHAAVSCHTPDYSCFLLLINHAPDLSHISDYSPALALSPAYNTSYVDLPLPHALASCARVTPTNLFV